MVNWSGIPDDLIDEILNRLRCVEDFVRCGAVCSSWRSITVAQKELHRWFNPWLFLPENYKEKRENQEKAWRVCFSTCNQKKLRIELPEAEGRKCLGSGYGWLMTLGLDLNISLLNPLSHALIPLPSQPTMRVISPCMRTPENIRLVYIERFAVSSTPSSSSSNQDFVIMVIYGAISLLSFASPGDQTWTFIETDGGGFGDVIYFDGKFYAVRDGYLYLCEIDTPNPKVTLLASPAPSVLSTDQFYLVEMSRHLHVVARVLKGVPRGNGCEFHYETTKFEVYRFDFHSREWIEFPDMGEYALFLGTNATFSISTSDYPEVHANCIYFTDDHFECYGSGFCDMGVYDYQSDTSKPFYSGDDVHSRFSPPLLFIPAL